MALQIATQSPRLEENVGQYSPFTTGIVAGSGTSSTVDLSQNLKRVDGAVVTSVGSAIEASGSPVLTTTSAASITVTHGSGVTFTYIAWGIPKA